MAGLGAQNGLELVRSLIRGRASDEVAPRGDGSTFRSHALAHVSLREQTHVFLHFDVELRVVRSITE